MTSILAILILSAQNGWSANFAVKVVATVGKATQPKTTEVKIDQLYKTIGCNVSSVDCKIIKNPNFINSDIAFHECTLKSRNCTLPHSFEMKRVYKTECPDGPPQKPDYRAIPEFRDEIQEVCVIGAKKSKPKSPSYAEDNSNGTDENAIRSSE